MSSPTSTTGPSAADPESEPALVAALRRGDERAYGELVRSEGPRLLRAARRLLGDEHEARDAVQEGFLKAFESLEGFEGKSKLSTWLHRIVVNAALMRLRRRRRKPEVSIEELLPTFRADGHLAEPVGRWAEPADAAAQRREVREGVRASIDRLPDNYRNVLLLRDIEGLEFDDIAASMGITTNAVKIRLHRARQALRALLDGTLRTPSP